MLIKQATEIFKVISAVNLLMYSYLNAKSAFLISFAMKLSLVLQHNTINDTHMMIKITPIIIRILSNEFDMISVDPNPTFENWELTGEPINEADAIIFEEIKSVRGLSKFEYDI